MTREQGHHFQLGYGVGVGKGLGQSETAERFFGEARRQEVLASMSKKEAPESLKLGITLRQSHVRIGTKCLDARPGQTSEQRTQYVNFGEKGKKSSNFNHLGAELRKENIDHAYGHVKTCSHWTSVDREEMSRHAKDKFACEMPSGFQHLIKELRKSNLPLTDPRPMPRTQSESQFQYTEKPYSAQASYAATLGKDLRASHIDIAQGHAKTTRNWVPVCHAALNDNSETKWACDPPDPAELQRRIQLGIELRKSSVPLSGAGEDFMMRGPTMGLRRNL